MERIAAPRPRPRREDRRRTGIDKSQFPIAPERGERERLNPGGSKAGRKQGLRRKAEMKRGGEGAGLTRKTRLSCRNQLRAAERRQRDFGEYGDFYIPLLPCAACAPGFYAPDGGLPARVRGHLIEIASCPTTALPDPSVPAHMRSRGAGGEARHILPQCWDHHELHHEGARTFEDVTGLDTLSTASRLWTVFYPAMEEDPDSLVPAALRARLPRVDRRLWIFVRDGEE